VVADAIVSCHLRTMARLDIHYDLLARESEILHLKFWDAAFEKTYLAYRACLPENSKQTADRRKTAIV
jgi:hypothetical protein